MMPQVQSSHQEWEQEILKKVSRSFALTIPQLPARLRPVVTNGYLLCRIADTIEDAENLTVDQKGFFFREFIDVLSGNAPANQFGEALYPLLSDGTLPAEKELIQNTPRVIQRTFSFNVNQQVALKRCATIMSRGMQEFQETKTPYGLENLARFNSYCYHVAGVVGELLTELFCEYSKEISNHRERMLKLATSFGQGLQMTNILKDLWDDKDRGASWLPKDVFEKVSVDLRNLSRDNDREAFGEGLAELIGIAGAHLRNALNYSLLIPPHEKGIRKFCLWAIGMAIFTLKNIDKNRNYTSGSDVKITRRRAKAVIFLTNATLRSNYLVKKLFDITTKNLPMIRRSAPVEEI